MVNNINHKVQRYYGGNWGHPRKHVKKLTKIEDPISPEVAKYKGNKKYKKKVKKEYKSPYDHCPFCKEQLIKKKQDPKCYYVWPNREAFCRKCGALEIQRGCPACKHNTWINKEKIYKHMNLGCGFSGKRKE